MNGRGDTVAAPETISGVPALEVTELRVSYGDVSVLTDVDLQVGTGEVLALLGRSGCGKTTLLRSVAGFVVPESGTIRVHGREVSGPGTWVEPQHRGIGLVPQEGALFPHLDVASNVSFGLLGADRAGRAARTAQCLELVGLAGMERRRPAELSGGQQQRVALARALAPSPDLVLLDEPFSALDAGLRNQLREEVRSVLKAAGVAAVLVTHDQAEALSFSERVAVMDRGRIVQVADPVELYRHPVDPSVGAFVGESTLLEGVAVGPRVETALGLLEPDRAIAPHAAACGGPPQRLVLVRPEQVVLDDPGQAPVATPGLVLSSTYFGHDALVRVALRSGEEVIARVSRTRLPEVDAAVMVSVEGPVATFAHDPPSPRGA